ANCVLQETAAPASPSQILIGGQGVTLATDNLAGYTLLVNGNNAYGNAVLTLASSLSNDGTIVLQSSNNTWSDTLTLTQGALINAADGTIQVNVGTGGARIISGSVINAAGTINFDTNTTLGASGVNLYNSGLMSIAGAGLSVVGKSFTNEPGGLISGYG